MPAKSGHRSETLTIAITVTNRVSSGVNITTTVGRKAAKKGTVKGEGLANYCIGHGLLAQQATEDGGTRTENAT